jgi:DNA-binding MarR family transcriptional regulator
VTSDRAAGGSAGVVAGSVGSASSVGSAGSASSVGSAGDETLQEAFMSVARQLRHLSQEALAPWDITPSQLRALRVLAHDGVMRLSELSEHLRIAPRSTTEVVDALESRGLIQRRPDPGDRRATLVELTEQGVGLLDTVRAARGVEAERVFGRLSAADRDHLARILRALRD